MKKLLVIFFLVCFCINTYNAFSDKNCLKDIKINNLNSKNLYNYLKDNDLLTKVNKVCSENICKDIHFSNIEFDIESFIKKNIEYLKNKGDDVSLNAELKGFPIERILVHNCE